MARASYKDAINWIANNDDNEWLNDHENCSIPSVTASFCADIFQKEPSVVAADIRKELKRLERDR